MENPGAPKQAEAFRSGAFHRSIALIFGLQLVAVVTLCLMGMYNVAPFGAILLLIVVISVLAWMAAQRQWRPVRDLARYLSSWDGRSPHADAFTPPALTRRTDADLATLSRGLYGMAGRIASYNQRERNFTRDASHELRSPLTVIKMSTDMLGDEAALSSFGQRSVQRIRRATREMESLVEALLILARESDNGSAEQAFVVNDVLRQELGEARELLEGRAVELTLDEPARFALYGSPRVFSVLCWQLIRNACQQTEQGRIVITVFPDQVVVSNRADSDNEAVDRHGFELAIAERISERFAWPLELQTRTDREQIARIHFPQTLPAPAA
jgi:signal transduction histidine kinase